MPQVNPVIDEITKSRQVLDRDGRKHDLHSEVSTVEGEFLAELISSGGVTNSIEIGLAYGLSALYICTALQASGAGARHTTIDPYQTTYWNGIGLESLKRAKYDFVRFIEEPSEIALAELLKAGEVFDFALIDGNHDADYVYTDFLLLHRLVRPDGLIVFDDAGLPEVQIVIHFALNHLPYEVVAAVPGKRPSMRRRALKAVRRTVRAGSALMPRGTARGLLNESMFVTHPALEAGSSMICLRRKPVVWTKAQAEFQLTVVEADLRRGLSVAQICQKLGVTELEYQRCLKEYGAPSKS